MGIVKRLNLVMVSAFALLLGCLMFTSLDTAWGAMYQEGDVWIGTDGEQMTTSDAFKWRYEILSDNTISLTDYTGTYFYEGRISGYVPSTINGMVVTELDQTFKDCKELTTAPTIPTTVTKMKNTFENCTNLSSTPDFPEGLTSLDYAFSKCNNLISVSEIPDSVTSMEGTFQQCIKLVTAPELPNEVTNLKDTFSGCSKLTNAPVIPSSVINMEGTFRYTKLKYAPEIPDGVISLKETFSSCQNLINPPAIPNTVTNMEGTFDSCSSLTTAPEIPKSVTNLRQTFRYCWLITDFPEIPDGVTDLYNTFAYCDNLTKAPEIPDGVTNLSNTFQGCINLTKAPLIPASIESMSYTFEGCTKLSDTIFIPVEPLTVRGLFDNTVEPITVQYLESNRIVDIETFPSNVTKQKLSSPPDESVDPAPGEDEDEEQDPTTPSNPGETSGNMSIYGTVQPITMIDVTVPLTIQFTIESDRTFTGPDSIEIKSNCPSPLDVNLYGVNKDDSAPSLVAPDTHSDDEWNNLSRAETLASIALMLDNTSLSSTGSTLGRIDSAFQSEKVLDLDLSAKYGKAWDNSEDLVFTYNVVFEFAMP